MWLIKNYCTPTRCLPIDQNPRLADSTHLAWGQIFLSGPPSPHHLSLDHTCHTPLDLYYPYHTLHTHPWIPITPYPPTLGPSSPLYSPTQPPPPPLYTHPLDPTTLLIHPRTPYYPPHGPLPHPTHPPLDPHHPLPTHPLDPHHPLHTHPRPPPPPTHPPPWTPTTPYTPTPWTPPPLPTHP